MTVISRAIAFLIALAVMTGTAEAQNSILQAGPISSGRVPMYVNGYSPQAIVQDSGPAAGGGPGVGLSELGITQRGANGSQPPFANAGTGPFGTNFCDQDAPSTNPTGYHDLCFGPNSNGGGLIDYGTYGNATALPFSITVNGITETFPFSTLYNGSQIQSLVAGANINFTFNNGTLTISSGGSSGGGIAGTPLAVVITGTTITAPVQLQDIIIINKGTPSATSVVLPAGSNWPGCPTISASLCPIYTVKDGAGNAGSFPITITAADGKTIDGLSSQILNYGYESIELVFNGTQWNVL